MIKFLKKHQCCLSFLSIVLAIFTYFYLTYFRYEADRYDDRHYPLPPLTEKWSTTIEYKALPHVKFNKCLLLTYNSSKLDENLKKRFGERYYDEVYQHKYTLYHVEDITEEEFYQEAKAKPHFWLKIYKENVLVETRELYFTNMKYSGHLKVDGKEFFTMEIIARPGYKQKSCYSFDEDTQYRLEIINDTIVPEFEDVDVFFTIKPITPKV